MREFCKLVKCRCWLSSAAYNRYAVIDLFGLQMPIQELSADVKPGGTLQAMAIAHCYQPEAVRPFKHLLISWC